MSRWSPENWRDPPQPVPCDICCKVQPREKLYVVRLGTGVILACLPCFMQSDLKPRNCDDPTP